jgi:hypothetical protein
VDIQRALIKIIFDDAGITLPPAEASFHSATALAHKN